MQHLHSIMSHLGMPWTMKNASYLKLNLFNDAYSAPPSSLLGTCFLEMYQVYDLALKNEESDPTPEDSQVWLHARDDDGKRAGKLLVTFRVEKSPSREDVQLDEKQEARDAIAELLSSRNF